MTKFQRKKALVRPPFMKKKTLLNDQKAVYVCQKLNSVKLGVVLGQNSFTVITKTRTDVHFWVQITKNKNLVLVPKSYTVFKSLSGLS